MKFIAVLSVLLCTSLCNSEKVTTWGDVNTSVLSQKTIEADPIEGEIQMRAFAFSGVSIFRTFSVDSSHQI